MNENRKRGREKKVIFIKMDKFLYEFVVCLPQSQDRRRDMNAFYP